LLPTGISRQIGAKRQTYDPKTLEHAANLVRSNSITLNQASKTFCVPKTTLQNAVHNKYSGHKVGHKTYLNATEEQRIVKWAMHMSKLATAEHGRNFFSTVQKILDDDGRVTPFRDNRPGRTWLDGFFRRHQELSLHTTMQLGKERAIVSAEKIGKWFADFKAYTKDEVGDQDMLTDPTRIYNADETDVSLCMKGNKVVGFKGSPVM